MIEFTQTDKDFLTNLSERAYNDLCITICSFYFYDDYLKIKNENGQYFLNDFEYFCLTDHPIFNPIGHTLNQFIHMIKVKPEERWEYISINDWMIYKDYLFYIKEQNLLEFYNKYRDGLHYEFKD